ncbi:MAG TPA: hypothetical protein VF169_01085 [Albitalea sp.]|uniref:hypothetical protein n=1 Tax=Piscinibacter sp. TaxID=1903157 RepID=UPI002ED1EB8C
MAEHGPVRARTHSVSVHAGARTRSNVALAERVFTSVVRNIVETPNSDGEMQILVSEVRIAASGAAPAPPAAVEEPACESPPTEPSEAGVDHAASDPQSMPEATRRLDDADKASTPNSTEATPGIEGASGVRAAGDVSAGAAAGLRTASDGASSSAGLHAASATARIQRVQQVSDVRLRGGGRSGRSALNAIGLGIAAAVAVVVIALLAAELSPSAPNRNGDEAKDTQTSR